MKRWVNMAVDTGIIVGACALVVLLELEARVRRG